MTVANIVVPALGQDDDNREAHIADKSLSPQ